MRTTDGTTTLPTNSQASHPQGRSGDQRGLITLEWLLIVGAVAGLAATSVLAVQRVLDDTSEVPVDPLVRVLEADIAAAFIAADANTAWPVPALQPTGFQQPDEDGPAGRAAAISRGPFADVVDAGTGDDPGHSPRRPCRAGSIRTWHSGYRREVAAVRR